MAYPQTTGKLPYETASRTGHLPLMSDPLIRDLVHDFRIPKGVPSDRKTPLDFYGFTPGESRIRTVIACDGSYSDTSLESCDLVYIRAGIESFDTGSGSRVLHPFRMQEEIIRNSASIQTVLPAEIPCSSQRDFELQFRRAIYKTLATNRGQLNTLRWIFAEGWGMPGNLPPVQCPQCGKQWDFSACDEGQCTCGEPIFVTDILGWEKDLRYGESQVQVAGRFMLVLEFLLLMTCIRQMWQEAPEQLANTLFLHDGPLSLGGRHTNLIMHLRRFCRYAAGKGTPVLLCGAEKTGRFVSHLQSLRLETPEQGILFAVPTHAYIQQEIDGRPLTAEHRYGERHLLGERVFVLLPGGRQFVLTVPSALEQNLPDLPQYTDLIGLEEILRSLPNLVTPIYDNALYPITRVNALVSMSQEPSGRMLEMFSETLLRERVDPDGQ